MNPKGDFMELSEDAKVARKIYHRKYQQTRRKTLTPEQREAQREYKRAWDKANPEKVQAAQVRFFEKMAEKMKACGEL